MEKKDCVFAPTKTVYCKIGCVKTKACGECKAYHPKG